MLKFLSALFMKVTLRVSPSSALRTGPGQIQKNILTKQMGFVKQDTGVPVNNKLEFAKKKRPYLRLLSVETQVLVSTW